MVLLRSPTNRLNTALGNGGSYSATLSSAVSAYGIGTTPYGQVVVTRWKSATGGFFVAEFEWLT
jgi:hypothetical protein